MQPDLIITPFGESADPGTIRPIPESTGPSDPKQNASWEKGFPSPTMIPISSGGVPPEGPDMNGVLNAISQHTAFIGGGGQYKWSAAYVAAKGGYAKGSVIQSDDGLVSYVSTIDVNSANFNTDPSSIGVSWEFYSGNGAGKDTELRQQLNSLAGAGVSGFLQSESYDPNTVGSALKERPTNSETTENINAIVSAHNNSSSAHPELTAGISADADRAESAALAAEAAKDSAQSAVSVNYNVATLADRNALTATTGQAAYVRETGLFYSWTGSAWSDGYKGFLQDKANTSTVEGLQLAASALAVVATTITRDFRYNWSNGSVIPSAGYAITDKIDISGGKIILASGVTLGSGAALATYFNAAGTYLGIEQRGVDGTSKTFTDFKLSPPVGASYVGLCSNGPNPSAKTPGIYITQISQDAKINENSSRISAVYDAYSSYNVQKIETVNGAYLNPSDGAVVANSSFIYSKLAISDTDKIKVSARLSGTGVCLAVYYNSSGSFLGREKMGTATVEDVVDYQLTIPSGTTTIGITSRTGFPITIKKLGFIPISTPTSKWQGKVISNMGDSNVQQWKWQPLVISELGCTMINNGVGGSKIAKPDSAPTQISMCDDARISALDLSADAWILGPWGTNDWAQRVPIGDITDTVDTTVYGALNVIAKKVRDRSPTKFIMWVTPFNGDYDTGRSAGWIDGSDNGFGTIAAYAAAIRAVAYKFGFPLIDLNAECGWNSYNSSSFLLTEGSGNLSRIHLNALSGPERISRLMLGGLRYFQP